MNTIHPAAKTRLCLVSLLFASSAFSAVVADFAADFSTTEKDTGWKYQWNPTDVALGDAENYVDLLAHPSGYEKSDRYQVDLDNPPSNTNPVPNAQWLRIAKGEACPGNPILTSTDGIDHYAIVAYTIQPGEAGFGSIQNSRIQRKQPRESGKISIFVNDRLIGSDDVTGETASAFNVPLGPLHVGDTVYVAFGPGGTRAVGAILEFQIDTDQL